jgi:hypothetical protein
MAGPDEDLGILGKMAEFLGLEGDELDGFITEGMTRKGHKPKTTVTWEPGDGKSDDKKSNILGMNRGGQKAAGSNWQY